MKEFFERLRGDAARISSDVIEKDFHLHRLLHAFSENDYLRGDLVFKGGTCLVKAYLGYYRFSEDIDFHWKDPDIWKGRTRTAITRECSLEASTMIDQIKPIAKSLGMIFEGEKQDKNQVAFRGGGRMVDFNLRYKSEILGIPARIKIQLNFMDVNFYPFEKVRLNSYIRGPEKIGLRALFEKEYDEYCCEIPFVCYDPREIFTEKCRAALTRKVFKPRDILDIYKLNEKFGYSVLDFDDEILDKIQFMIKVYEKYRDNLELTEFPAKYALSEAEEKLVLEDLPDAFSIKAQEIQDQLTELKKRIVIE